MTILELTKLNGRTIYVNLDLVMYLNFEPDAPTTITLCSGPILEVQEGREAFRKYLPK